MALVRGDAHRGLGWDAHTGLRGGERVTVPASSSFGVGAWTIHAARVLDLSIAAPAAGDTTLDFIARIEMEMSAVGRGGRHRYKCVTNHYSMDLESGKIVRERSYELV